MGRRPRISWAAHAAHVLVGLFCTLPPFNTALQKDLRHDATHALLLFPAATVSYCRLCNGLANA